MGKLKGRRPSPALLVAVVALVAALSGVAVAGVAVTSLNKKDRKQVRKIAKKLDKKAIKSIPAGPEGPAGPKGEQGEPGQNAAENVVARTSGLSSGLQSASCLEGERVVGGGAATAQPSSLTVNGPDKISGTPSGWLAQADDNAPTQAVVLCASP